LGNSTPEFPLDDAALVAIATLANELCYRKRGPTAKHSRAELIYAKLFVHLDRKTRTPTDKQLYLWLNGLT